MQDSTKLSTHFVITQPISEQYNRYNVLLPFLKFDSLYLTSFAYI